MYIYIYYLFNYLTILLLYCIIIVLLFHIFKNRNIHVHIRHRACASGVPRAISVSSPHLSCRRTHALRLASARLAPRLAVAYLVPWRGVARRRIGLGGQEHFRRRQRILGISPQCVASFCNKPINL